MGLSDHVKLHNAVPNAAKTLNELANPKYISADKQIPQKLLRHCKGIAFITIYKAGIMFIGGNVGGGCVIVKIPDSNDPKGYRWSPPCSVKVAGLGGGFVWGGEKVKSVIILNTQGAIEGFTGDKQVKFGGSVSLAAGPTGRDASANVGLSDNKKLIPAFSYSVAKGIYLGATLEGAVLKVDDEDNANFYGRPGITPLDILSGQVQAPLSCEVLYQAFDDCISASSVKDLAASGRELLNRGLSGDDGNTMPPGWQVLYTEEGKPYYYEEATQKVQWEKPSMPKPAAAPAPLPPPPPPAKPSLPTGWQELKTPEGKPYYFNTATNTTQWEHP